jgi:hypothetical protein
MTPRKVGIAVASIILAAVLVAGSGCHGRNSASKSKVGAGSTTASANALPLDRLLKGELSESSALVFGFPVPNGMTVERVFPDAAHLVGEITVGGLLDYVRKHAKVGAPELTGSMMVFDPVSIPSQGERRRYRFEINSSGGRVRLLVRDTTPPPLQPGLSDEERWRQAGLKPNGEPINVTELR